MELVVDANILFSELMKEWTTRELMLNDELVLFAPEYIIDEFLEHIIELERKTYVKEYPLQNIAQKLILESNINIIPLNEIRPFVEKAKKISPDPHDVLYFATAIRMNCSIWSNDKKLKSQNIVNVYATHDLIKLF